VRIILFTLAVFFMLLGIMRKDIAQAVEVVFTMSESEYKKLTDNPSTRDGCFYWFHTFGEQSPVKGKPDSEKLAYCVNQVVGLASFGRVKSLEDEGITVEVRR